VTWRVVPLVGLLVFYGIGFGWRTWLHVRRYGGSGVVLFQSGRPLQHVREAGFVVLALVLLVQAAAVAMAPPHMVASVPPSMLRVLRPSGLMLLLAGIAIMVVGQLDLGASWRVGIEERARPGLVTDGLYRFSRNPIFLAMLLALTGYALLVPTWLSLLALVLAFVGIRQQVGEEEAWLARAYGDDYRRYARRVGRFVPGLGRLA
jgi:protein-S-isoprenylcysteine O-methyltransferase Ste14